MKEYTDLLRELLIDIELLARSRYDNADTMKSFDEWLNCYYKGGMEFNIKMNKICEMINYLEKQ